MWVCASVMFSATFLTMFYKFIVLVYTLVIKGILIMPTNRQDIFAWSLIALAAEPYVVSVLGTYTPILLEQIARENGVLASDRITPCVIPSGNNPVPNPPPPNTVSSLDSDSCLLPIFGKRFYIDTSSYALYTFSVSVLLQTVCVLTVSGISDNSTHKKLLILSFGFIGGFTTMMFYFLNPQNYYMASLLAMFANCSFGCVNVLMNSYLTILIKNYSLLNDTTSIDQNSALLADENFDENSQDMSTYEFEEEIGKIGSKISGIGTSTGYSAALFIQILSLFTIVHLKDINDNMIWCIKIVIALIGLWWFLWQVPILFYLRNLQNTNKIQSFTIKHMIKQGYHDLIHAIKSVHELKDIYFFLLGWFVLSDSITTINSTAILFAKTNLKMPMVSLSKIGILVMISAITGSIFIPQVVIGKFKCNLQNVLISLIVWCLCVPIYGIVALNSSNEMYFLAIWYGIGLGGLSTVSRSIYSIIIPSGKESIFFSIFSLTDKTSSIIGPLVIGLVINIFHELRGAFWLLALLLIVSIPILSYKFKLNRARTEALSFE